MCVKTFVCYVYRCTMDRNLLFVWNRQLFDLICVLIAFTTKKRYMFCLVNSRRWIMNAFCYGTSTIRVCKIKWKSIHHLNRMFLIQNMIPHSQAYLSSLFYVEVMPILMPETMSYVQHLCIHSYLFIHSNCKHNINSILLLTNTAPCIFHVINSCNQIRLNFL